MSRLPVLRSTTRVSPSSSWWLPLLFTDQASDHISTWTLWLCPIWYLIGLVNREDIITVCIQEREHVSSCASVEHVLAGGCGDQQHVIGPTESEPSRDNTLHSISS